MKLVSIETVNCSLTFFLNGVLAETKSLKKLLCSIYTSKRTSRAFSLAIEHNAESLNLANTAQETTEIVLGSSQWDIADEN